MEIWEPKPSGTLWATPGLLRDCFTFTFIIIIIIIIIICCNSSGIVAEVLYLCMYNSF